MKNLVVENSDKLAVVDDEDFERLDKYKWFDNTSGRLCRQYSVGDRNFRISLANEVLQVYNLMFDHKDRDSYNNKKENLRPCTYQQNNCNKGKRSGLTSIYKGVCLTKTNWVSRICKNRKIYHLGCFRSQEEAAKAYDIRAKELFGEFAVLNFPIS